MQIVGYRTAAEGEAALLVADEGTVRREPLAPGADLAYVLGERHCAGRRDGDRHLACDHPAAPYCPGHTSSWPCARCAGNCSKPLQSCRQEHAVYLAAFAPDAFKVGVTRSWRVATRLREQGADRAVHVHTVSDGRIARKLEADIAAEADVPDRIRVPTKVRGLPLAVDDAAWADLRDDFPEVESFAFDYGLSLERQPVAATAARGTVRGTKGRVLVLDHAGTTYAVDLRDLVGYDVGPGPAARPLQSSLGAFDGD